MKQMSEVTYYLALPFVFSDDTTAWLPARPQNASAPTPR
jgi:hypothetical protein